MKHPSIVYLVLCLWCWAPLAQLRAVPLSVFLSGSAGGGGGGTSPGTANLDAWWALENANDSSAGARNLSTGGSVTYTAGKVANAFTGDASGEYLYINDAAWMERTGSFSFSLWVKATDATPAAYKGIVAQGAGGQSSWWIALGTGGLVSFGIEDSGGAADQVDCTTALSDNTWTHIACTFQSSTALRIYFNGVENGVNTTGIPAAVRNSTDQLFVGAAFAGSDSFQGQLDEVGMFNDLLTTGEITWLYNAGSGKTYSDL
jgi:hypothetical protein